MEIDNYVKPMVMKHQPIMFETAHSWNPGMGAEGKKNGNNGINFPNSSNPNPTPDGAGAPGQGTGNGNAIGKGKNT